MYAVQENYIPWLSADELLGKNNTVEDKRNKTRKVEQDRNAMNLAKALIKSPHFVRGVGVLARLAVNALLLPAGLHDPARQRRQHQHVEQARGGGKHQRQARQVGALGKINRPREQKEEW